MTTPDPKAASAAEAEALVPQFELVRLLNQDQAGRRISLYGTIKSQPALMIVERAAFSKEQTHLQNLASSLSNITNLGNNDIYHWYMACHSGATSETAATARPPDFKINLIYPCTEKHVQKYSAQGLRSVQETPEVYQRHVRPYMAKLREEGRLNWVFNIIEGRKEQEDVIHREHGEEGFLLLPDLNWDRKTITSLHLLGIVERRDIWSIRDLRKKHTEWLKHMREKFLSATVNLYPEIEKDQLKLYFHYQPTYHHLHIHIVHTLLDAGATQAVGKAIGVENIISILEVIGGDQEAGIQDMTLAYTLGEESDLWVNVFGPLAKGQLQ